MIEKQESRFDGVGVVFGGSPSSKSSKVQLLLPAWVSPQNVVSLSANPSFYGLKALPTSVAVLSRLSSISFSSAHVLLPSRLPPSRSSPAMALHLFHLRLSLLITLLLSCSTSAKLKLDYYQTSCPRVHEIISEVITTKQINSPTTAAGALRLFFHDCFVSGCDASVLISSNHFNKAERDAEINLSLPGDAFDAIIRAKTALELQCPGVVSCADILAIATATSSPCSVGAYPVRLGRKDSLSLPPPSRHESNLARPNASIDQIISIFASKGLHRSRIRRLSGAHGRILSLPGTHDRIFHFNKKAAPWPPIPP
ncbi:hypothetical protein HPP92_009795 [Vanilla planifolia]|uniref:Peroxidase n=1 Tax=Vanilla planifolia TaxID=51239 RepID=A0A835R8T1_VANPL|nr:hypothetical protein HPP92_009795 [Vanilla planifolia]